MLAWVLEPRVVDGSVCESVCGDGWFNLCTLIVQCTKGVQPHPAPECNQSDSGQVKLLKQTINHTHSQIYTLTVYILFIFFVLSC